MTLALNFLLSPKAIIDLEDIYDYSFDEFGELRAEKYINDLNNAFNALTENISISMDYGHVKNGLRAYKVVSHIIFFKSQNNKLIILRILHKSMDYIRHLDVLSVEDSNITA